jgi:hypothetical protein
MTLANPAVTGNVNDGPTGSSCTVDTFKAISGTSTAASTPPNPPTLCGVLDGSHSKKKNKSGIMKVAHDFLIALNSWGQFHQHFTCSFFVQKLSAKLFCA